MGVVTVSRRDKEYPRYRILKRLAADVRLQKPLYLLLPFSKRKFPMLWLRRRRVLHDFFVSDFDGYVNDRRKGPWFAPSALWKYLLDWWSFHGSDALLADTATHLRHWESLFGRYRGEVLVFPVLADETRYRPSDVVPGRDVPRLLYYGYFIPLHGVDVMLRALSICEARGLRFRADFIGTGQKLPESLALAEQLELRQVHFNRALIPAGDLAAEIRESDIVLGIFGDSQKSMSVIPNKVYEALACRRPVVTGDSPAVREFFGDEHLMLVERNPAAVADAIEKLLADPAGREAIARRGHEAYQALAARSMQSFRAFLEQFDD
jgi:glycosyltransferase involved in cell wall biosynthesis